MRTVANPVSPERSKLTQSEAFVRCELVKSTAAWTPDTEHSMISSEVGGAFLKGPVCFRVCEIGTLRVHDCLRQSRSCLTSLEERPALPRVYRFLTAFVRARFLIPTALLPNV